MFQWASDTFDKLSEKVAPPPTDAASRFGYAVTRLDENTAMGCIAEIDPIQTIVNQSRGWFPIHMACQYSMVRLIRLLMNQPGASIQQMDYANCTPLHHACMSTQRATGLEVVKILINECGADPCAKNSQGQTPYDVATLDSIRQYILPIQLQRETQYALDNGGKGLPPGIDMGGMKINRANMAPPPTFGGAGVVAAPTSADPSSRYPQTPGMTAPSFGSPMAAAGGAAPAQQQQHQQPQHGQQQYPQPTTPAAPAAQPIARAPASMPGARSQSTGAMPGKYSRSHARSGGSSLAIYSKYKADGFHSSSSDKNLQAKYGHVGVNAHTGPPPPSSGNAVAAPMSGNSVGSFNSPPGPNPFSGAPVSRYASYAGQTTMASPASGPVYSGMGYGMPTQPQTTPSFFTPGATNTTAAIATPSSSTNGGPTSPFMPPPPYSGTKTAQGAAAAVPASTSMSPAVTANLFESPPEPSSVTTTTEAANNSGVTATAAVESKEEQTSSTTSNDWVETTDPTSGKTYYFNSKTNETSWENPNPSTATAPVAVAAAPPSAESASNLFESPPNSSGVTTPATAMTTAGESKEPTVAETKQEETSASFSPSATSEDTSSDWVEVADPTSGKTYYFNSKTNETSWDNPNESTATAAAVEESTTAAEQDGNGDSDWSESVDPSSGKSYYYNSKTGETSWEKPTSTTVDEAMNTATATTTATADNETSQDASDWVEATDPSSGNTYYYNSATGETSWERPSALDSEENSSSPELTTPTPTETAQSDADTADGVVLDDAAAPVVQEEKEETAETESSPDTVFQNEPIKEEADSSVVAEESQSKGIVEESSSIATATKPDDDNTPAEMATAQDDSIIGTEMTIETTIGESSSNTLPDGWIEATDPSSGKVYYCNTDTQETSWERPVAENAAVTSKEIIEPEVTEESKSETVVVEDIADGWEEVQDPTTGNTYYFNKETQETSWEKPTLTIPESAKMNDDASSSQQENDWVETLDPNSGKNYYYNAKTDETSWENPATFKMQKDSPVSTASETQPVDGNAAESKPTSAEDTFAEPAVNVDTKSEETNEVKPRSSPLSIRSTVSAEDMFSSPPGKNQSNGTPGPFNNFDRPDFISPAAATQGSVESPGGLDTPVATAEDLFGANDAEPAPINMPESNQMNAVATTAEDLFGANDAEPAPINMPESNQMNAVATTAEDLFGGNDAEPALVKTLEPLSLQNVEDSDEIDDGDMTDIPLTPGPESLIKSTKDLPSIPNTTIASPAPAVREDLFAAIGLPPPPFQSKR